MKLGKKIDYQNKPEADKKEFSGKKVFVREDQIDYSAELPNGKHKGRTLEWVEEWDAWYFNWMQREGLIAAWGLVKAPVTAAKKSIYFISDSGQQWIGLREVPGNGMQSQYL